MTQISRSLIMGLKTTKNDIKNVLVIQEILYIQTVTTLVYTV